MGQDLWGRPPSPFSGVWDLYPEALTHLEPGLPRSTSQAPPCGPTDLGGLERGGHGQLGQQSPVVPCGMLTHSPELHTPLHHPAVHRC